MLVLNSNNSRVFNQWIVNSDFSLFWDFSNARLLWCKNWYAEINSDAVDTAPSISSPIFSEIINYQPIVPFCYEKDSVSWDEIVFRKRVSSTSSITTSQNWNRVFIAGSCWDKTNFSFKWGEKIWQKVEYNLFIASSLYFNNSRTIRNARGGYELKIWVLHTDTTKTYLYTKDWTLTQDSGLNWYTQTSLILNWVFEGVGITAQEGDTLIWECYVWYKWYTDNRNWGYEWEIVIGQGYLFWPMQNKKDINTPTYYESYYAKYNRGPAPIIVSVY